MPEININNKQENIDLESYRTLTELLPAIKENFVHEGECLTSVRVNGINIINTNQKEMLNKPLNEIRSINIDITNRNSILLDSIDSFQKYIDHIFDKISLAVKFISNNQLELGDTVLIDITETLNTFIKLISQIHRSLIIESDEKLKSGTTIRQLEIHLLSVLKAILYAKKKEDNVMLIDLLEHELKDNLTQWKITAIPQIKRMNTL